MRVSIPEITAEKVLLRGSNEAINCGLFFPRSRDHNRATADEVFKMMTSINVVHVPYRGGSPALRRAGTRGVPRYNRIMASGHVNRTNRPNTSTDQARDVTILLAN